MAPRRGWHVDRVGDLKPGITGGLTDNATVPVYLGDERVDAVDNFLAVMTLRERIRHLEERAELIAMLGLDQAPRERPQVGRCRECRRRLFMRSNGTVMSHLAPSGRGKCGGSLQFPVPTQLCAYTACDVRFETGSRPRKYCSDRCGKRARSTKRSGVAA